MTMTEKPKMLGVVAAGDDSDPGRPLAGGEVMGDEALGG